MLNSLSTTPKINEKNKRNLTFKNQKNLALILDDRIFLKLNKKSPRDPDTIMIRPDQNGFCEIGVLFANKQIHIPNDVIHKPTTIFNIKTIFASKICLILRELE